MVFNRSPAICTYPDEKCENLIIEVVLPGIEKKDISFKIAEDVFYVDAKKEEIRYWDSYMLCCLVDSEKAVAKYSNGVLNVTVPYKLPLEKLTEVKIE